MIDREKRLEDFCEFSRRQILSRDIDPMYPVLANVYEQERLEPEQALWRTFLYVTWYNAASAEKVWTRYPAPRAIFETLRLPTGVERRGFRGNDLAVEHVNAMLNLIRRYGSMLAWVEAACGKGGERGWREVRQQFRQLPWAGHWSSYKWADLLKHVHGMQITADDIGVGGGGETAGPIPGMVWLTGHDWRRCATDVELQRDLMAECVEAGVPFDGLDQLETCLCDMNSLQKGHYYVGHDIDVMQENLTKADASEVFWAARRNVFDPQHLGEVGGWRGVRKPLLTVYSRTGVVA